MNAIVPHIFEDNLVRSVIRDQQPWFVGADVCKALALRNAHDALDRLDHDEKGLANADTLGGPQMVTIVSEPGVFRLIFTSRKPEAERFKRWLAHDVLPKLRTGSGLATGTGTSLLDAQGNIIAMQPLDVAGMDASERMRCVDLASRLHGMAYARQLWRDIGLPRVAGAVAGSADDGIHCLDRIMAAEVYNLCILDLLTKALDDPESPDDPLRDFGILVDSDGDGFIIANRHEEIEKAMKATKWAGSGWGPSLRRLNGSTGTVGKYFSKGWRCRGTWLPASALDMLHQV